MTRTLPDHLAHERHLTGRAAWLRAGVLGANDGLISTASLMVGVAAADSHRSVILIAGFAGLTAGALAMAAGAYVSVSSQRDTELADLERERSELATSPDTERDELAAIYRGRGLTAELADRVADELSQLDRLQIHARDELGFDITALAKPVQASLVSALSFITGAILSPSSSSCSPPPRSASRPPLPSLSSGSSHSAPRAPALAGHPNSAQQSGSSSAERSRYSSPSASVA